MLEERGGFQRDVITTCRNVVGMLLLAYFLLVLITVNIFT